MGYSPHYLMFGCRPRLLVNLYFPTFTSAEVPKRGTFAKCVDNYCPWLIEGHPPGSSGLVSGRIPKTERVLWLKDRCCGSEAWQSCLSEGWCLQGRRRIKDRWEDEPHQVVHQFATDVPSYKVTDQCGQSCILHCNWLLLVASETGIPLYVSVCQAWDRCTSPTPVKPTPKGSDSATSR